MGVHPIIQLISLIDALLRCYFRSFLWSFSWYLCLAMFFRTVQVCWHRSIHSYFEKHHLKSCVGVVDSTWPVYCYFILCVFFRGKKSGSKGTAATNLLQLYFFPLCSSIAATNLLHLSSFFPENLGKNHRHQKEKHCRTRLNPGLSWARTSMELKTCAARHVFARHISARHIPHDPFPSPGLTMTYAIR